jgi:nucleotide-binding universal stress UspA family protein
MFHSILVPLDGSPLAEQAIPAAVSLAKSFSAKLALVRVPMGNWDLVPEVYPVVDVAQLERDRCQSYLVNWKEKLEAEGQACEIEVLAPDQPAQEVCREAHKRGCDLIVMASHGRSGLERMLLGSVAERVVRFAHCHVLTVRQPAS